MTLTEALCLLHAGWMHEEQRELYEEARNLVLREAARLRLEHKIKRAEQQLSDLKGNRK